MGTGCKSSDVYNIGDRCCGAIGRDLDAKLNHCHFPPKHQPHQLVENFHQLCQPDIACEIE